MPEPLTIFVHRASECLTDHVSHGDGLICFSLLNGLAERGHTIYAYANSAPIRECSSRLHVKTARHRVPANSLAAWEHSWRAERWLNKLMRTTKIDLVWRMHPYGDGCPYPPRTYGKPLVIGPLFSEWPADFSQPQNTGQPRFGVSIKELVRPSARRGWQRTLESASLLIAATSKRAASLQEAVPTALATISPVIVDSPFGDEGRKREPPNASRPLRLLLVANLLPNKNAVIFCETIKRLKEAGVNAEGTILGDGPGRNELETYRACHGLENSIFLKGSLPHAQVWDYLHQADILVSCSWFEAYGRSIVEAMSVGTPVVCYSGSVGPAEIIENGVDGLLVSDLTAEAYADVIAGTIRQPSAWERLSERALHTAQAWRKDVVLSQLEESLYQTVQLSGRRQS